MAAPTGKLTAIPAQLLGFATRPVPRLGLAIAFSAAIYYSSSRTTLPVQIRPGLDKIIHAISYFLLGLSYFNVTTRGLIQTTPTRVILAWVGGVMFAASDEWHQSYVPGRTPDILDLLADAGGITLAVGVCLWGVSMSRRTL